MKSDDLTKGSIKEHVKRIAIPASIGFFFNTMYNVIDTFFAGQLNTNALAAMSASFPVFFMIIALGSGIGQGTSALISNALGAKNKKKAKELSSQAISFSLIVSIILTFIGLTSAPFLFKMLGASGEYLQFALDYINIIFYTAVFFLGTQVMNGVLIATGDTKSLRNFMIFGFFLNILLDPWFMYGGFGLPAMGIGGIALATVIIQAIGTVYITYKANKTGLVCVRCFKDIVPRLKPYKEIASQGFPASLNMMTVGIGIFIITYFLSKFGTDAVAAYGISTRIEQIALMPTIGLNMATLAMIGQNNGAKKYDRLEESLKLILKYGIYIMLAGAAFIFLFARPMMNIFTDSLIVINIGVVALRITAITSWAYVILAICISSLQGMKKPFFGLWIGLSRQIIAPFLIYPFLAFYLGWNILGIWWGTFLMVWAAAIFALIYTFKVLKSKKENN